MAIHDRQGARQEIYKLIQAPASSSSSTEELRKAIEEDGLEEDEPDDDFQDKGKTSQ